jgi:hypothetical protein
MTSIPEALRVQPDHNYRTVPAQGFLHTVPKPRPYSLLGSNACQAVVERLRHLVGLQPTPYELDLDIDLTKGFVVSTNRCKPITVSLEAFPAHPFSLIVTIG